MRILAAFFFFIITTHVIAQPHYTTGYERNDAKFIDTISIAKQNSIRNIGPTIMSGRVVDIDVNPSDPTIFYTAYASGGLWKTTTNGNQFFPIFDHEKVITIGDIAVDWTHKLIWVGTGENNSSRSSYAGNGIYKSNNDGKSWVYCGLPESHHIGRIILHPNDTNTLWVGALGHLYSKNKERGVYKSTDGGKSWKQSLYINDSTGVIDMTMDPNNSNIIYAAAWTRERKSWNFTGFGAGSGIYKSEDGGNTWNLITSRKNGFPSGDSLGRIGIVCGKSKIYAIIDNNFSKKDDKKKKNEDENLTVDFLKKISKEDFLKLDKSKIKSFLENNDFPDKYTVDDILNFIKTDKYKPTVLVDYVEDANNALFNTNVIGAELYESKDGGIIWKKTHEKELKDLFFTYGYYFCQVRIDAFDDDKVYLLGTRAIKSLDGGKSFTSINTENVHWDHHALWINPLRKGHIINGNDGGINISYDDGITWVKCNNPAVGQFYSVAVDNEKPYNVYGGLQDNGVWVGSSTNETDRSWYAEGTYPFKNLLGGDGMQVQVDARDNNTVYTGFQFGNYFRINKATGESKGITPHHELGEYPLRFNWQTPILLSKYNQEILYLGANKLYRSMNKGTDWESISPDLTKGSKKGNIPYGTLTTISESPKKFGYLYTGSDDGYIHFSSDNGDNWKRISDDLPQSMWVSRVQASVHNPSRVYTSLNGYRWDDFTPYLYMSDNQGIKWDRIGLDLPLEPINVVLEDPNNENLIYVGTDNGLYFSLNRGKSFNAVQNGLPRTAVHDLVIHKDKKELVIGTHGRSIYIMDISKIELLKSENLEKNLILFDINNLKYNKNWGQQTDNWTDIKTPDLPITFYSNSRRTILLKVKFENEVIFKKTIQAERGMNIFQYDLSLDENILNKYEKKWNSINKPEKSYKIEKSDIGKYFLNTGSYQLILEAEKITEEKTFFIENTKK